jgi:hypothetical protein
MDVEKSSRENDEKRADLGTASASVSASDENEQESTISSPEESSPSKFSQTWRTIRQTRLYQFLSWTPPRCRWDPSKPPQFSMALNVLFGFAACFTVANLYYSHPILNVLAEDFGVSFEDVSQVCENFL